MPAANLPTAEDPEKSIPESASKSQDSFADFVKKRVFRPVKPGVETYTGLNLVEAASLLEAASPLLKEIGLDPNLENWAVWKLSGPDSAVFTLSSDTYWITIYKLKADAPVNAPGIRLKDGFIRYSTGKSIQIVPGHVCISYMKP